MNLSVFGNNTLIYSKGLEFAALTFFMNKQYNVVKHKNGKIMNAVEIFAIFTLLSIILQLVDPVGDDEQDEA